NGPPFLWLLSFGGAKESSSPSGARTRLKKLSRQRRFIIYFQTAENVCVTSVTKWNSSRVFSWNGFVPTVGALSGPFRNVPLLFINWELR
ncbi:MAG: hypothetical protein WAW36_17430, partial [Methylovulum miyakonense]